MRVPPFRISYCAIPLSVIARYGNGVNRGLNWRELRLFGILVAYWTVTS